MNLADGTPLWPAEWTAVGTVALAIVTVAAIVTTIFITKQDRKRADKRLADERERHDKEITEERALADRRLAGQLAHSDAQAGAERDYSAARLREERDHAEEVRRRERQADNSQVSAPVRRPRDYADLAGGASGGNLSQPSHRLQGRHRT